GRGQPEQLVRGVAHRRHDDDEVVPGRALAGDAARDALDAIRIRDGGATVLLHDELGWHGRGILPRCTRPPDRSRAPGPRGTIPIPAGARPASSRRQSHGGAAMCFDYDSRPPIAPIAGGAIDSMPLVLTASDRNRFAAFRARADEPTGAGIVILPDVRGLHPYYEELALRFAEKGVDALALDWFGRTAGAEPRGEGFDHGPPAGRTTGAGAPPDLQGGVARRG